MGASGGSAADPPKSPHKDAATQPHDLDGPPARGATAEIWDRASLRVYGLLGLFPAPASQGKERAQRPPRQKGHAEEGDGCPHSFGEDAKVEDIGIDSHGPNDPVRVSGPKGRAKVLRWRPELEDLGCGKGLEYILLTGRSTHPGKLRLLCLLADRPRLPPDQDQN